MIKKSLLVAAIAVLGLTTANAQEDTAQGQTSKGKWLIEANTGFTAGGEFLRQDLSDVCWAYR